ncbi:lactoylglutathione lyase [Algoriphagus ratkowskyi]|uniref:Glyoxalase/bleomycin resistance/extradiol dioxygenase family protein n=1 Tax=Algoriphagus ratkowskyi TaxID=57028 RepID=A0A2W7S5U0_9BACT|nr:VOC family protein [Algoriphagus ratkowskyi]PZX58255.1 lactoylglutathione lyase [Algoriphagus ratkowskyi]TXD77866.1 glyoxalase/bleomycin resistance/extradiol dioxygenase family protein [Algoriphagus ratkowskyi]
MKIEHLAIWVHDLEQMKNWYCHSFAMTAGEKYENHTKGFSSYFLSFSSGTRLELMKRIDILESSHPRGMISGLAHFAISVGSKEKVLSMTENFRDIGISIIGEPRTTGDGYFESVIEDPEGNWIEITI